jgi:hypothetical protein
MLKRRTIEVLLCFSLAACIASFIVFRRSRSLEARIRATASKLKSWSPEAAPPKDYEVGLVALAAEPTSALQNAYDSLDAERSNGGRHGCPNDEIWLTGTLVTILAFECPPVPGRDAKTWYLLKSKLEPPGELAKLKKGADMNQMLAKWPREKDGGTWHLLAFSVNHWGTSDGAIAPFFRYYKTRCPRRRVLSRQPESQRF